VLLSLFLQDSDLVEQQPEPGRPAATPAVCEQILQPVPGETNNDDGKSGFTSQARVLPGTYQLQRVFLNLKCFIIALKTRILETYF
jgi:hypothetical protein